MRKMGGRYLAVGICVLVAATIGIAAKMFPVWAGAALEDATISYVVQNTEAELGTDENPFTILEIVPNRGMAMIGYLIPGCEPVDMDALLQDDNLKYTFKATMSPYFEIDEDWRYQNRDVLIPVLYDGASTYDGFVSQVVTVTPAELTDENLDVIGEADMIVISALRDEQNLPFYWEAYNKEHLPLTEDEKHMTSFHGVNGNDLSWNATMAILARMASEHPAALMIQDTEHSGEADYNIEKLYLMLMQYGPKTFYDYFVRDNANFVSREVTVDGKTFVTGAYRSSDAEQYSSVWNEETFVTKYGISAMHESQILVRGNTEVFGSIVTFGGYWNFYTEFSELLAAGYGDDYYRQGGNSEVFDYYEKMTGNRAGTHTMGQALHYALLCASGKLGYKDHLRILEISPNSERIYGNEDWQIYYKSLIPWFAGDMETDLQVTAMPSYQFIGDSEDLNAEYDLILFTSQQDASNGLNGYNDKALNVGDWENGVRKGYIYTSVGDYVTTDWLSLGFFREYRYSSNDLTKKKLEELKDYMRAGKPIIVDKNFYSGTQVKTSVVDPNSYVYQLASMVYVEGVNENPLFRSGFYCDSSGRDLLRQSVATPDCELEFAENGYPTVYSAKTQDGYAYVKGTDGSVAQTITVSGVIQAEQYDSLQDSSGRPILRYVFTLKGESASTFGIKFYIDRDGDGVYRGSIKEQKEVMAAKEEENAGPTEELTNLYVADATDGNETEVVDGNLYTGHTYIVTVPVPANKRGILPWKLEVYDKQNDSIRDSYSNYTAIRAMDTEKEKIRVLQMNLMPDMRTNGDTYVNFADTTTVTGAKFAAYLSAVQDFNVEIAFMENKDWYHDYSEKGSYARMNHATKEEMTELWKTYLDDVDMLIIGFTDVAAFTSDEVFYEGFMDFVNQGKSVILSHDLVHDVSINWKYWGRASNYDAQIRTLAGQRVTREGVAVENEYMDNNVRMLIEMAEWSGRYDRVLPAGQNFSWPYGAMTTQITLANEGQITSYPYVLGDTITISGTHAQNFGLDLEYSKTGDVNVWYNLSGGVYDARPQDARNNYYMYSKGNITYTGLGHLKDSLTDDEVKLFVNTMISAYRITPQKPYIRVNNTEATRNDNTYTMYVMLTGAEKETDTLPVNFTVAEDGLDDGVEKQYTLQYQDADGNMISPQIITTDTNSGIALTAGEAGYVVSQNGTYSFDISYKDVMEQGEVTCYLRLNATYYNGSKLVETGKVTKVIVYAMPLFELN